MKIKDTLLEIQELRESVQDLKLDNDFLRRQNSACKLRCREYAKRVHELELEVADLRFTHKYLTSEEAGKAFARELLGKPMTEEEFITAGEAEYERTWNLDGDDF